MDHKTDFNSKVIVKIIEISMQNNEFLMFGCRDFVWHFCLYTQKIPTLILLTRSFMYEMKDDREEKKVMYILILH